MEIKLSEIIENVPGSMRVRYPWVKMQVGDWFLVPTEISQWTYIQQTVRLRNKKASGVFSVEMIDPEGGAGAGWTCKATKVTRIR